MSGYRQQTGVPPDMFQAMCAALEQHLPHGGRQAKHCLQDRLLMTLLHPETGQVRVCGVGDRAQRQRWQEGLSVWFTLRFNLIAALYNFELND